MSAYKLPEKLEWIVVDGERRLRTPFGTFVVRPIHDIKWKAELHSGKPLAVFIEFICEHPDESECTRMCEGVYRSRLASALTPSREGEGLRAALLEESLAFLRAYETLLDENAGVAEATQEYFRERLQLNVLASVVSLRKRIEAALARPLPSAGLDQAVEELRLHFHKYCNSYLEERSEPGGGVIRRWTQEEFAEEVRSILQRSKEGEK